MSGDELEANVTSEWYWKPKQSVPRHLRRNIWH